MVKQQHCYIDFKEEENAPYLSNLDDNEFFCWMNGNIVIYVNVQLLMTEKNKIRIERKKLVIH